MFEFLRRIPIMLGLKLDPAARSQPAKTVAPTDELAAKRGRGTGRGVTPPTYKPKRPAPRKSGRK